MSQCSQPVQESISTITNCYRCFERAVGQLRKHQPGNIDYDLAMNEIEYCFDELEVVEMTVGNLRVTKIGKLLSKYEKELPKTLSLRATNLVKKWKDIMFSYRENIKKNLLNIEVCIEFLFMRVVHYFECIVLMLLIFSLLLHLLWISQMFPKCYCS